MKKLLVILPTLFLCAISQAQERPQTDPSEIKRVTVWDIPRTDSFLFLKGVRPILAYTANYKPVYILATPELYDMITDAFDDSATKADMPANRYIGFEFGVDYLKGFSLYSRQELKNMKISPGQKLSLKAFNERSKYTVMGQSPHAVLGKKVKERITNEIRIEQILDDGIEDAGATIADQKKSPKESPKDLVPKTIQNANDAKDRQNAFRLPHSAKKK